MAKKLDGLRVLVLEDEFLIAMDVEQLCRDHGAHDVILARTIGDAGGDDPFEAAIVDVMLNGASTLEFAQTLKDRKIPFVFASGYSHLDGISASFPGVPVIGKPYSGTELVDALATACGR